MPDQWYVFRNGRQEERPYSSAEVRALAEYPGQVWVWREGMSDWAPPGTLAEFTAPVTPAAQPCPAPVLPAMGRSDAASTAFQPGGDFFTRSRPTGAGWLYLVVVLSLINAVMASFMGANLRFVFGLNVSSLIAGAPGSGADIAFLTRLGAFLTSLTPISVFGLLAWNADRYRVWPFAAAMALYAFDSVFSLLTFSFFDVLRLFAFHGWYQGYTETCG